jgi:molybdopterin-guanine dinucleotide biosynthesis protein A/very-short-patch-repair endonuclease
MRVAGLILAGGRSSRMGQDKAFVQLGDTTLLEHVYQRLSPQCEHILISTNSDDPRFSGFQTISDSVTGQLGPLAGILAGLKAIKNTHEWLVTTPVDCPFLPYDLVDRFMSEAQCPPSPLAGEGTPKGGERGVTPSPKKQLILRQFAKNMRSNSAPAEKALWTILRAKRFNNFKFKRQIPIDHYIADFVCFEQRLIIEADGSQHNTDPRDKMRDAYLTSQNFRVRRFWNEQIFTEKNMVCDTIWADLMGYTTDLITPLPPYRVSSNARGEGYNRNHKCLPSPLAGEGVAKRRERGKERDNLTSKLILARSNTQPHHTTGLWHISLIEPLKHALNNDIRKVQDFTQSHNPQYIEWNTTPIDPFFNINTQADLALASAALKSLSANPI